MGRERLGLAAVDRLTDLAESGQLTRQMLSEAMRDEQPGLPGGSVGFTWIINQPELFGQAAARLGMAVDEFLLEHAAAGEVGCSMLVYAGELLRYVPYEKVEGLVRDIYLKYGAFSSCWMDAVCDCGVRNPTIVQMILEKLESQGTDERQQAGITEVAKVFLDGDLAWTARIFDDEQLLRALRVCARRAPEKFLQQRSVVERRLGERCFAELAQSTQQ